MDELAVQQDTTVSKVDFADQRIAVKVDILYRKVDSVLSLRDCTVWF